MNLKDIEATVERRMAESMTDGKPPTWEMMRLVNLLRYNGYLLFPSAEERRARENLDQG